MCELLDDNCHLVIHTFAIATLLTPLYTLTTRDSWSNDYSVTYQ